MLFASDRVMFAGYLQQLSIADVAMEVHNRQLAGNPACKANKVSWLKYTL